MIVNCFQYSEVFKKTKTMPFIECIAQVLIFNNC